MIVIFRPWLSRLVVFFIATITFGLIRIDRPRIARLRTIGSVRRWWMARKARSRGRRDGRLGIPRVDEENSPPEVWKLKQQGDGVVRGIAATWSATDARLTGEHEAIQRSIKSTEEVERDLEAEAKKLGDRCEARRDDLKKQKAREEGRKPDERWRIPSWFYVIGLGIIFVGEFPLNAVAFNLFGENRWPTYAMTAGLAAVLVFCAHSLGILWRQRAMSDRDMIVTVLLTLLPVAVIVGIAVVREEYLQALNQTGGGLAVLSPAAGIGIFIVMNLVIYMAAFALSYLHHDPIGELLERVEREVARADRATRHTRRRIDDAIGMRQWLTTKLALWEGAREEAHREAAFEARRHKDFFEAFMQEYWAANRRVTERALRREVSRARRRGEQVPAASKTWRPPKSLETPPEIAKELMDRVFHEDLMSRLADVRKSAPKNGGSTPKRRRAARARPAAKAEPVATKSVETEAAIVPISPDL